MKQHSCSTHQTYRLTCEQYQSLVDHAAGACWRCRVRPDRLCVDHDHDLGINAVRGMLCDPCNRRLAQVDAGTLEPDEADAAYLAGAWHVGRVRHYRPDMRTPIRYFRFPDGVWENSLTTAGTHGDSVPDIVRLALRAYAADPTATIVALTQIRSGDRG